MRYKILKAGKTEQLNDLVNDFLSKGWKLNGPLVGDSHYIYQVVTKKEAGDD